MKLTQVVVRVVRLRMELGTGEVKPTARIRVAEIPGLDAESRRVDWVGPRKAATAFCRAVRVWLKRPRGLQFIQESACACVDERQRMAMLDIFAVCSTIWRLNPEVEHHARVVHVKPVHIPVMLVVKIVSPELDHPLPPFAVDQYSRRQALVTSIVQDKGRL